MSNAPGISSQCQGCRAQNGRGPVGYFFIAWDSYGRIYPQHWGEVLAHLGGGTLFCDEYIEKQRKTRIVLARETKYWAFFETHEECKAAWTAALDARRRRS